MTHFFSSRSVHIKLDHVGLKWVNNNPFTDAEFADIAALLDAALSEIVRHSQKTYRRHSVAAADSVPRLSCGGKHLQIDYIFLLRGGFLTILIVTAHLLCIGYLPLLFSQNKTLFQSAAPREGHRHGNLETKFTCPQGQC